MIRLIAGVVTANLAAPLLYLLFIVIFINPDLFSGETAFVGIIVQVIFLAVFLIALPISLGFALLGWFLRVRSSWFYLLGGVAVGMAFGLLMNDGQLHYPVHYRRFLMAAGIGAICGWIYWLIAVRDPSNDLNQHEAHS